MIIRSRAPLRIGFAGGGTDVSPYSDRYGGAILNASINLFAHAAIELRNDEKVIFRTTDGGQEHVWDTSITQGPPGSEFILQHGLYNRILKQYGPISSGFTLTTSVDAPPGSGLGSSSTLMVAMLGAFVEWLGLPLGDYEIARLAYEIERVDLGLSGGKQDQYAACFGGVNFMEFFNGEKVIVNPLRIREDLLHELEACLLLYHTGQSRSSSDIIKQQVQNVESNQESAINAMHDLKRQAVDMKEALLTGRLLELGSILDQGWIAKKKIAIGISNTLIESVYNTARTNGASGGKISGAGGGGHAIFFCPGTNRAQVEAALQHLGGECRAFQFVQRGLTSWRVS